MEFLIIIFGNLRVSNTIAADFKANGKLMNMSRRTDVFDAVENILDIPVNNLYLDKTILRAMQLE